MKTIIVEQKCFDEAFEVFLLKVRRALEENEHLKAPVLRDEAFRLVNYHAHGFKDGLERA